MHIFFYNAFILLYTVGIRIAALWNKKAALWLKGRAKFPEYQQAGQPCIWMHCASLGEFEQGRPVIERLKTSYPHHKIVLTFFSPSGYEIRKNYTVADAIFYLPADTAQNAKRFIDLIRPSLVIWIKYDYWFHYLTALKARRIPVLLVSGIFRESQPFFKWYGKPWQQMLKSFAHLFVQNKYSVELIKPLVQKNVSLNGDTRFDRVIDITKDFKDIDAVKAFCGTSSIIVAGSTWEEDEAQLIPFANTTTGVKLIVAPHEISEAHIADLRKNFKHSQLFSTLGKKNVNEAQVLIIDNIGLLSRLYKYAHLAYVGGGFNSSGIHNILEAAVYGVPVVFGPEYSKFEEAKALLELNGAFSFTTSTQLEKIGKALLENENYRVKCGAIAGNYVQANSGATKRIMDYIAENRLLTN